MNELWSIKSAEVEIVSEGKRKMSGKKPESGAQKRKIHKEKLQRESQLLTKIPKLTGYFKAASPNEDSDVPQATATKEPASTSAAATG